MISPLTGSNRVRQIGQISADKICELYQQDYQYDVRHLLRGADTIEVYRCLDTDFAFYYPTNLDGDGPFYEHISTFSPEYYADWKWEHQQADAWIKPGDRVLEPGCAKGAFLKRMGQKNVEATGLELNEAAVREAQEAGLDVHREAIESFAGRHAGQFDVVCSFQVVEHIAAVKSFIEAQVACLRPSGKLIISVPNNDFYGLRENLHYTSNLPPHHMGRWNETSLRRLTNIFPLKVEAVYQMPLQKSDYLDIYRLILRRKVPGFLYPVVRALTKGIVVRYFKNWLPARFGRVITIVYSKR